MHRPTALLVRPHRAPFNQVESWTMLASFEGSQLSIAFVTYLPKPSSLIKVFRWFKQGRLARPFPAASQ